MPYWLSLLADLLARDGRPDAARATLDAALAAAQCPRRRVVAARGDADARRLRRRGQAAISRLRSAAQMASAHGSVALLRRCERDLGRSEAFAAPAPGVLPLPDATHARER